LGGKTGGDGVGPRALGALRRQAYTRDPAENPPIGELSCEPDFFKAEPSQITVWNSI